MLFVFEEEKAMIKGKVRLGTAETISALFDLFYCSSCMYRTVLCPTKEGKPNRWVTNMVKYEMSIKGSV